MSLLREPPERIALYAMSAYGLAAVLTVFNIACSYFYFRTVAPGGAMLGFVIAVGIALLVNVIETGTTMVFLSADEAGHLFTPPRIEVAGFPRLVPKLMKFAILALFGFVLCWTYKVDLESTKAVLQATGAIGWYVVVGAVFGSEFLMVLGHTLWGLSKFGKANTAGMWSEINNRLKGLNSVPMRPQKPAHLGGGGVPLAEEAAKQQPTQPQRRAG